MLEATSAASAAWRPLGAWAGIVGTGRHGSSAGLRITLREDVGLATIVAADGQQSALAGRLFALRGWDMPAPGRAWIGPDCDVVWSASGQWLAVAAGRDTLRGLAGELSGLAAVTEQSDSRALLRIAGPEARACLSKGVAVDLHSRAFTPGSAAVTAIAHVSAQIWQRNEQPAYEIAVPRSFAASFWSWLVEAAAEFGDAVETVGTEG